MQQLSFSFFGEQQKKEKISFAESFFINGCSLQPKKKRKYVKKRELVSLSLFENNESPVVSSSNQVDVVRVEHLCEEKKQTVQIDSIVKETEKKQKKKKKVFSSVQDEGFDEILRKACSLFFYNNRQFNFISLDPSITLDDMVSECYLNAIKKGIFKNKTLNETVIYFFVKQVFITRAIYQTRHFKDVFLKDENYELKKTVIEDRLNDRNKFIESDLKELKVLISKLSDKPVIDGFFVYKDIKTTVSLKSMFGFISSGFSLKDILDIYSNENKKYQKKYLKFMFQSMYDTGEVELRRLAGTDKD